MPDENTNDLSEKKSSPPSQQAVGVENKEETETEYTVRDTTGTGEQQVETPASGGSTSTPSSQGQKPARQAQQPQSASSDGQNQPYTPAQPSSPAETPDSDGQAVDSGAGGSADKPSGGRLGNAREAAANRFNQSRPGQALNKVKQAPRNLANKASERFNQSKLGQTASKINQAPKNAARAVGQQISSSAPGQAAKAAKDRIANSAPVKNLNAGLGKVNAGANRARELADRYNPKNAAKRAVKKATDPAKKLVKTAVKSALKAAGRAIASFLAAFWPYILAALVIIAVIIIIFITIASITSVSHSDGGANSTAITQIESGVRAKTLEFTNPTDLDKIKEGVISAPTLGAIANLSKKHENLRINYSPDKGSPVAFDVAAVDKIKCTDTSGKTKSTEIPVNLEKNHNWSQNAPAGTSDNILCAVGYYPQIDTVKSGKYATAFGPGEFKLKDITTAGPKAAQEKTAEIADEIIAMRDTLQLDPDAKELAVPISITLEQKYGRAVIAKLQDQVAAANTNPDRTIKLVTSPDSTYAIHISFFE